MVQEYSLQQISKIAQISEGLAIVSNTKNTLFKSQTLDERWPRTIYEAWRPFFVRLTSNPNDPTLRGLAEWIMQLCGPLALQAQNMLNKISSGTITLSGPSNQSVNVGANASFTVSVTSGTGPFTYQWFVNGVSIPGATSSTYTVTNAQVSQSGNTFFAQVSNGGTPVTSQTATLTVTAVLVGYYYQGADYSADLEAGNDDVPYQGTFNITTGQPFTVQFPTPGATAFIVVKYPITEPTKTHYNNPPIDSSALPNVSLGELTITTWKYIYSWRGNPFGLNGATGQVTFS